jgi:hypothetical protein
MTWRAPLHYAVDDVASTGTLNPKPCVVDEMASTVHYVWMTWRAPYHDGGAVEQERQGVGQQLDVRGDVGVQRRVRPSRLMV